HNDVVKKDIRDSLAQFHNDVVKKDIRDSLAQFHNDVVKDDIWNTLMQFNNKVLAKQFDEINQKISKIEKTMANKKDLKNLKIELKSEIGSIRKFLITIEGSSNQEYQNLSRRIDYIEAHLHLVTA
ncbi:hypothetical protein KKG65_03240, partial [Patescibacteria group bacterium]|nr:hypothetical protein [Patescibacteria group bacterium]